MTARSLFVYVVLGLVVAQVASGEVHDHDHDDAVGEVAPEDQRYWKMFETFVVDHKRLYSSSKEKLKRFAIFRDNMVEAEALTELHNGSATFGPTRFSDLSKAEFARLYLTLRDSGPLNATIAQPNPLGYPAALDWVAQGKVTPVRQQGGCGSCWAHCVLGEIESHLLIKWNIQYSLSVQQLVDCDTTNYGCQGGIEPWAFQYIYKAGGVMQEVTYPYIGYRSTCRFTVRPENLKLYSSTVLQPTSSDPTAVFDFISKAPSTAAFDASYLQNYQGGVFNMPSSSCPNVNHCVMIVGYDSGASYFKIKNSWGTDWGEKGYFRMNTRSCMINTRIYGSSGW